MAHEENQAADPQLFRSLIVETLYEALRLSEGMASPSQVDDVLDFINFFKEKYDYQ